MATEAESVSGRTVEEKLRKAWRRERRFYAVRGICHLLLWAAGLIAADFIVDWLFLLPGFGRTLLLITDLAVLVVVFYRSWWRHLERYDPVKIALQVERRHPDLKSLLVSYIQFGDGRSKELGFMSPQLIRAVRRLAVAATRPIDFREIIHWGDLTRVTLFSAAVVVVCGGLSVNWPDFLHALFTRLLNPTASVAYPTRTRIVEITGPVTVPEGASVTLAARGDGLIPASGTLSIKPPDGDWERIVMPQVPDDQRKFSYSFNQILRGFQYRVRLGDATSQTFEVRSVPPPRIVKVRVHLHYPAYTKWADKTIDSLQLEVPEGTQASVQLTCDRALRAAAMLQEGGQATPMRIVDDGLSAEFGWTVKQSFPFHFRWTEAQYGFQYEGDVTYFVRVIADSQPEVELVSPAEDDKATVEKKLAIRYRASDDYGIARAAVVYTRGTGQEQRRPLGTFEKPTVDQQVVWNLKESIPDLKEGDWLTLAVEVADNRAGAPGPNVVRTRPVRLDVVSVAEYLLYMQEKRARLAKEIQAMHEEEKSASREVKTMLQE